VDFEVAAEVRLSLEHNVLTNNAGDLYHRMSRKVGRLNTASKKRAENNAINSTTQALTDLLEAEKAQRKESMQRTKAAKAELDMMKGKTPKAVVASSSGRVRNEPVIPLSDLLGRQ
jgi:hypothetical protein